MRDPPEIPSWLASACSWASLRPARPLLLAGAAVNDPAAEDDVSTAEDSSVVSVTKDPSPSTASRLGAGRDDLIWAAVQICSRDFGLAGWILASTAGYSSTWRVPEEKERRADVFRGAEIVSADSCVRPKAGGTGKYCAVKDERGN
jgi:hypothetical protein